MPRPRSKAALQAELEAYKAEAAQLRRSLGARQRHEAQILKAVREVYEVQPTLVVSPPQLPTRRPKGAPEAAILAIGDTQIGKVTSTYNVVVAEQRILRAGEKLVKLASYRNAPVDTCYVWFLGDMVEGESIFGGQPYEIEIGAMQQAVHAAPQAMAKLCLYLRQYFAKVHVRCVVGNHGRIGSISQGSHPKTNWDRVSYEVTALLLKGVDVDFQVAPDFWWAEQVLGHGHLLVHGDQIGGAGTDGPLSKAAMGWIDSVPASWRYLWMGHFHNARWLTVNRRVVIVNGSTESDNLYAQRQLKAQTDPLQWCAFANEEHGIISLDPLYLLEPRSASRVRKLRASG